MGFCMRPHLCLLRFVYRIAFILVCSQSNCTFAPLFVLFWVSYSVVATVPFSLSVRWVTWVLLLNSYVFGSVRHSKQQEIWGPDYMYVVAWTYLNNYSTVSMRLKKHVGCFNRRVAIPWLQRFLSVLLIIAQSNQRGIVQSLSCCLTYEGTTCLHESFLHNFEHCSVFMVNHSTAWLLYWVFTVVTCTCYRM